MTHHNERIEHSRRDPSAPLSDTSQTGHSPGASSLRTPGASGSDSEVAGPRASDGATGNMPAIVGFVSSLATVALTLGFLVSVMLPCGNWLEDFIGLPILISPVFWIAGVVLSILGIRRSKRSSPPHRSLAVSGIVMTCGAAPLMGLFAIVMALGSFYNCF